MTKTLTKQSSPTTKQKIAFLRKTEPRLFYGMFVHRNTKGDKMSFKDRPWIYPIYTDKARDIVVMKSVQCGITEWLIVEALSLCERALAIFYVLPKYTLRNTFVSNRIDKLFNMVGFYKTRLKAATGESDSKEIKHYAKGTIKFASSQTVSDFGEFPADAVIIDELDRCDQGNIAMAEDRVKASKFKYTRKVGNPTVSGYGIADEFGRSDQKEWMITCAECGTKQKLDFFKNIVREVADGVYELIDQEWAPKSERDIQCYCHACEKPINRMDKAGQWVPQNPDSNVSGYHITRLMECDTTVAELWDNWQKAQANETKKQIFFNSDLGIPYESKGAKLSDYLLDQCVADFIMPQADAGCIAGVDVGSVLHVKISKPDGDKRFARHIATVPTFEELDNLIKRYGIECMVIDALPETHKAKELRDRNKGIVWLCTFHAQQGSVKEIKLNHEDYMVNVDRTQSMDDSHADILLKKVFLPKNARTIDDGKYYEQMCAPTRIYDDEKKRFIWSEGSRPDHYRLAENYEKIAQHIVQNTRVKIWDLS